MTAGREVEQSAPFGSSSPRSSDSNECNQLVETEQSSSIEEIEVINSTSTRPSIETLQNEQITGCDIGKIGHEKLTPSEIEIVVKSGLQPHPRNFPNDVKKSPFPVSILKRKQQNGDVTNRDWLV